GQGVCVVGFDFCFFGEFASEFYFAGGGVDVEAVGGFCVEIEGDRRAVNGRVREGAVAVVHYRVGTACQFVDGRLNLGGRQAAGGVVVCDVGSIHVYGGDR